MNLETYGYRIPQEDQAEKGKESESVLLTQQQVEDWFEFEGFEITETAQIEKKKRDRCGVSTSYLEIEINIPGSVLLIRFFNTISVITVKGALLNSHNWLYSRFASACNPIYT